MVPEMIPEVGWGEKASWYTISAISLLYAYAALTYYQVFGEGYALHPMFGTGFFGAALMGCVLGEARPTACHRGRYRGL